MPLLLTNIYPNQVQGPRIIHTISTNNPLHVFRMPHLLVFLKPYRLQLCIELRSHPSLASEVRMIFSQDTLSCRCVDPQPHHSYAFRLSSPGENAPTPHSRIPPHPSKADPCQQEPRPQYHETHPPSQSHLPNSEPLQGAPQPHSSLQ